MRILSLLLSIPVFALVTPQAQAASKIISCYETEQAAAQYVENLEARDAAFHEDRTKLQELVGTPGLSYSALTFIFGDELEIDEQADSPEMFMKYVSWHIHLEPGDIQPNANGDEYCVDVSSKSFMDVYMWTVNPEQNEILTTKNFTEVTW